MDPVDLKLAELNGLGRPALIGRFREVCGRSPPIRLSTHAIALAVAYRVQEEALGGLSPLVLRAVLVSGDDRRYPPARAATPGTTLIREWQGRPHTVVVHADRVEYAGERFRSLTEVAFRITGQKRSGPAFFGLRSSRV